MIRDFNIEWKEVVRWIPAQEFQTYVTGAGIATGAPVFAEINSSGISGIQINQAADSIATFWHFGGEVDTSKQIRFRPILTTSSADLDEETVTVVYKTMINGTSTVAAPATALNTVVGAHTYAGANIIVAPATLGIINRNTLASTTIGLLLDVAVSMANASADEQFLLGLEVRYTPRRTAGPRRNILGGRRLHETYPAGVQLHATQEGL